MLFLAERDTLLKSAEDEAAAMIAATKEENAAKLAAAKAKQVRRPPAPFAVPLGVRQPSISLKWYLTENGGFAVG